MKQNNCPTCHTPIAGNAPGGFCPSCLLREASEEVVSGKSPAPSLPEMAEAFPELEILELIGQGGMGFVYKARQRELDRIVALKILSPELSSDPSFEERFSREARVLGKLQHPNVVSIYEQGKSGGFFYLMMEYVDGVNLRQAMAAGRFPPEQALALIPGICDALQAAHTQGIWHRDIKPENILLDQNGQVKIVDFGIARIVGDPQRNFTLTRTGGVLGSAAYMAPEQHESPRDVDHRADIYSLGVVIYEMLTGELPLGRFPDPSSRTEVNRLVDAIVLRTLEKERERRQQSVDEVKTGLVEAGDRSIEAPQDSPEEGLGLSRFVMWSIALYLGGGVFGGLGISVRSPFAIAIGGAVCVVGFLGCLWSLWKMKTRAWLPRGRAILISIVVVPMCLGVSAMAIGMFIDDPDFPRSKGGMMFGAGLMVIFTTILFWLALFLGRPLDASRPRRMLYGKLGFVFGLGMILGGGVLAKRIDGKWPFVGNKSKVVIRFDQAFTPSGSEMERLYSKAAGDYADQYLFEVDDEGASITAHCAHSEQPDTRFRRGGPSRAHLEAFCHRFTTLLPSDQLSKQRMRPQIERISGRSEAYRNRVIPFLLIGSGSFILALAGGRRLWWGMAGGVAFMGLLGVLHVWGANTDPPILIEGAPLPPFGYEEMPPADFSTPEKAVMSFFDAACMGELEIARRGASKALREVLDEHDEWDELLRRSSRKNASGSHFDRARGVIKVSVSDYVSGGQLSVVMEDGEWKLDDLNFVTPGRQRTGPFSWEFSPALAMKELLNAAQNRNHEVFRARLSKAFLAEMDDEGDHSIFGDFGKLEFVEVSKLTVAGAKILVETIDEPKRKFTFTMIQEEGQWKLSKDGF